jgi:hypothetical protein
MVRLEFSRWLRLALLTRHKTVCRIEAINTEQLKGGKREWIKFLVGGLRGALAYSWPAWVFFSGVCNLQANTGEAGGGLVRRNPRSKATAIPRNDA